MYLTLSKRFEFSASHRLYNPDWSPEQNRAAFGDESGGPYGHGHNYAAHFVFHGPVDSDTGMMLNLSTIKSRIGTLIDSRFDHKYLNEDTLPFHRTIPTAENVAQQLLHESESLFVDDAARPVVCHLEESRDRSAIAYTSGRIERQFEISFSAARRTCSPNLSDEENSELFGISAATHGHGHFYRLVVTVAVKPSDSQGMTPTEVACAEAIESIRREFDHTNLNHLDQIQGMPVTTECLARYFFNRMRQHVPVSRARVWETPDFSAEYDDSGTASLCLLRSFHAAHRLQSKTLSDVDNRLLYGKCNNPRGHGHTYDIEVTSSGKIDERTGTVMSLVDVIQHTESAIAPWRYKHLDQECAEFHDRPTTGENILIASYERLCRSLPTPPSRVRLWETRNNRFTLRTSHPMNR